MSLLRGDEIRINTRKNNTVIMFKHFHPTQNDEMSCRNLFNICLAPGQVGFGFSC